MLFRLCHLLSRGSALDFRDGWMFSMVCTLCCLFVLGAGRVQGIPVRLRGVLLRSLAIVRRQLTRKQSTSRIWTLPRPRCVLCYITDCPLVVLALEVLAVFTLAVQCAYFVSDCVIYVMLCCTREIYLRVQTCGDSVQGVCIDRTS